MAAAAPPPRKSLGAGGRAGGRAADWSAAALRPAARPAPPPPRAGPLCLRGWGKGKRWGFVFPFEFLFPVRPPSASRRNPGRTARPQSAGTSPDRREANASRPSLCVPPPEMAPVSRRGPGRAREAGVTQGPDRAGQRAGGWGPRPEPPAFQSCELGTPEGKGQGHRRGRGCGRLLLGDPAK